jgi:hypothetical protein
VREPVSTLAIAAMERFMGTVSCGFSDRLKGWNVAVVP